MPGVREHGVVVEVDGTGVSVRVQPESVERCASCGATCTGDRSGSRLLRVPAAEGVQTGARVVVETAPVTRLAASLLLLLVPLLGLVVGAAAGISLGRVFGVGDEIGSIAGGLLVMTLAYLAVVLVDRRLRRRHRATGARIVKVTSPSA